MTWKLRAIALSCGVFMASHYVQLQRAEACGGCFAPPDTITVVDSHRMAVSLTPQETILWDQIIYTGNPEDFAWILPVPTSEVTVELSSNEFFSFLDAETTPVVRPNPAILPQPQAPSGGFGCGAKSAVSASDVLDAATSDPVTVYDQGTVGPYETVTIGSEDRNALYDWLQDNGYVVPPSALSALDYYIDQEYVFVALRLAPGEDTQAMQPVRVRYPGYMSTFPLKGVVIGASGELGLSLWVIADQRYASMNYPTLTIDQDRLGWSLRSNSSNYSALFEDTIQGEGNGRAWITEAALPLGVLDQWSYGDISDDLNTLVSETNPYPFVTRLRTRMIIDHLDEDLHLQQSPDPSEIDTDLVANRLVESPTTVANPNDTSGCTTGNLARVWGWGIVAIAIALACIRRRRSPSTSA